MKKSILILLLSFVLSATPVAGFDQNRITIVGTGDSQALFRKLAAAFESLFPGNVVEVPDSIGSSGGIKAVANGKADLGRVARLLKEKEKRYGLTYQRFAFSPIVLVVNNNVQGISNLTHEQVVAIFSGKVSRWEELGASKGKIHIANREKGDSSRSVLEKKIPGFDQIETLAGEIIYTTPETVQIIARYPDTIGYVPLAMVGNLSMTILKIDGIYPTPENVRNGRYSLVVPFGVIWKGELSGLSSEFLRFVFGPKGQEIIMEHGAVPVVGTLK
jgi:phosphate transport system substrate-binding protein